MKVFGQLTSLAAQNIFITQHPSFKLYSRNDTDQSFQPNSEHDPPLEKVETSNKTPHTCKNVWKYSCSWIWYFCNSLFAMNQGNSHNQLLDFVECYTPSFSCHIHEMLSCSTAEDWNPGESSAIVKQWNLKWHMPYLRRQLGSFQIHIIPILELCNQLCRHAHSPGPQLL